ncbi:MAG: (2Fe-2S) ferredoxin domain-containing protein [Clostridia bacterium]|nr:(2Fe-2S) ferredoxin domain-containing protein [Clostridia bacterium]
MVIQICVGSSCYLKGSHELVELFEKEIEKRKLDSQITLAGCFCTGKCNREGVTVVIDDEIYTGVTTDKFNEFFEENVIKKSENKGA